VSNHNHEYRDKDWDAVDTRNKWVCENTLEKLLMVAMDIRTELKQLNQLLNCSNFINIPTTLRSIRRNTAKPRKKKAGVKK
jgi:hypothetical protein